MGETGSRKKFYEVKYRDTNSIIFDITDSGRLGSKKIDLPERLANG